MSEVTPSIGSLLEFDFEKPPEQEIAKLREYGGLVAGAFQTPVGLSNQYWQGAAANVFRAVAKALDRPISEILVGGWNHYEPFLAYCDAQRYPPDVPYQEELFEHSISASLSPHVKVLLNGEKVDDIKFALLVSLELAGGTVTIKGGRFIDLRPGKCWAKASLSCAGHKFIERKTRELVLPGVIDLHGIPIRPARAHVGTTG